MTALVFLVAMVVVAWRQAPPSSLSQDSDPGRFSGERAVAELTEVLEGIGPHPVGTPANAEVRRRLEQRFDALGLAHHVQAEWVCRGNRCAPVENLLVDLPGAEAERVLLVAHYDSQYMSEGAADDGAGVAALLEIARVLAPLERRRSVGLVLTDGEEMGLLGAEAFVASHPWVADTVAVINLEARGTTGRASLFQTSADAGWLIEAFARGARDPFTSSLHAAVYEALPNDTDLTVFLDAGLPGVNLAFTGGLPRYHSPTDDLAHLDHRSVQHLGQQALGLTRELVLEPVQPRAGQLVYTDVLGLGVVRWPAPWSLGLALAGLLGVMGLGERRGRTLASAGLVLLGLVAAGVAGWVVEAALTGLDLFASGVQEPYRWGCWLGALALGSGLAGLGARFGVRATWTAVWGVFALFGVALAATVPGVSVFFVLPVGWAVGAMGLSRVLGWEDWVGSLAGAALGLVLWLTLAMAFEVGVDLIGVLVWVPVMVAGQTLWPAWAASPLSRSVPGGLGLGALVAWGAMLAMPAATADRPLPLNEVRIQQVGESTARAFYDFSHDGMGRFPDVPPLAVELEVARDWPLARYWGRWVRDEEPGPLGPGPQVEVRSEGETVVIEVSSDSAAAWMFSFAPQPVVRLEGVQPQAIEPYLLVQGRGPHTLQLDYGGIAEAVVRIAEITPVDTPSVEVPEHHLPAHRGHRRVLTTTVRLGR